MEFRSLDVRRSPEDQGLGKHAYDLVIASNVLHATPRLEETMTHVRSLLKPGGHLLVVELTNNQHSRIGFIFGLFADWWAGVDEGRVLQPYVGIPAWDDILKKTGFDGVASRFEDREGHIFPTSVFRAQAVNDKVLRLAQPLSMLPSSKQSPIVIVGGLSEKTRRLIGEVQRHLPDRQVSVIPRLQDLDASGIPETKPAFLVLSELDDPLFGDLSQARFGAIKRACNAARHMLWLTEDAWVAHPHQAMAIGLRTLRLECLSVDIQVLNVEGRRLDQLDPRELCEHLLRLEEGSDWHDAGILWTAEPELHYSPSSNADATSARARISRLKPDRHMNDRLNARRREILADRNPRQDAVVMRHGDSDRTTYLQSKESYAPVKGGDPSFVAVRVSHSLVRALRVGRLGYFHLVLESTTVGTGAGAAVVGLAQDNGSLVHVRRSHLLPLVTTAQHQPPPNSPEFLLAVAADLVAQTLLENAALGAHIVVFMASAPFAARIALRATRQRVQVTFSTRPRPSDLCAECF